MLMTKEFNNKTYDNNTIYSMGGTNFALNNREVVYNLCLSVDVLLHKANISSPIDPNCSLKLSPQPWRMSLLF